jgi:hypothetical protein
VEEDLDHFLRQCDGLRDVRMMFGVGEGEALQSILMFGSDRGETEGGCPMWRNWRRRGWRVAQ